MSGTRRDGERDGLLDMVVGGVVSERVGRGLGGLIVVMSRKVFSSAMSENCDCPDSSSCSCLWALLVYRERQVETGGTKT